MGVASGGSAITVAAGLDGSMLLSFSDAAA
jgi:hypothetical protein